MSGKSVFNITKFGDKEYSDITFGDPEPNQLANSGGVGDGPATKAEPQ